MLQAGQEGMDRLSSATVAVIGLGGVGAMAAEMVVRAGVGKIIIADADSYSLTNKNRQIAAFDSTLGKKKTEVMRLRLLDINRSFLLRLLTDSLRRKTYLPPLI